MATFYRCPSCKERLYEVMSRVMGAYVKAADFKPVRADVPQPKQWDTCACPLCGHRLNLGNDPLEDESEKP